MDFKILHLFLPYRVIINHIHCESNPTTVVTLVIRYSKKSIGKDVLLPFSLNPKQRFFSPIPIFYNLGLFCRYLGYLNIEIAHGFPSL